ncbi:MAG: aminomethyltransferase family protein, partial [Terriglobia bacterium]
GSDRVRFLHNMVTNDVKGLTPGRGVYATILDLRGHILADLHIYCDEDRFLLETHADLIEKILATLGRYNIGGRVPLAHLSLAALSLQGPAAEPILRGLLHAELPGPEEFRHVTLNYAGEDLRVIRAGLTGEEGFELWTPASAAQTLRENLLAAGSSNGLIPCGWAALETLRIEAGIAAYGAELAEDTLPLEANLLNALSFTKGCYIGQEIVERARSRGHVNWKLAGLFVDSPQPPAAGEKLLREGKPLGEITSACVSPTLSRTIAMAYLRREVSEPGNMLELASGGKAEVTALPFYQRGLKNLAR